jgi:hypothetical protein
MGWAIRKPTRRWKPENLKMRDPIPQAIERFLFVVTDGAINFVSSTSLFTYTYRGIFLRPIRGRSPKQPLRL